MARCSGAVAQASREVAFREEFWDLLRRVDLCPSRRVADSARTEGAVVPVPDCELLDWAASGLMDLTGWPGQRPLRPPSPVLGRLRGAASVLGSLGELLGRRPNFDLYSLVAGRAASVGLVRGGRISAGGTCRLLPAADGWFAVNLARHEDIAALGAALGVDRLERPWEELVAWAAARSVAEVLGRLRLLGLPAAVLPLAAEVAGDRADRKDGSLPFQVRCIGRETTASGRPITVLNLASLWAGPLCGHLLACCGARVIQVDSSRRPDGLRSGAPEFFDFLHRYDETVMLDLPSARGVEELLRLLDEADVIIEASRPRALAQMGIRVEEVVGARPGVTWLSITGHGRSGDAANLVGFGDDAAVEGGMVGRDDEGGPVFCGDALADPSTGLYAAAAAAASVVAGGGRLVEVAMSSVAAHVAVGDGPGWDDHALTADGSGWTVRCGGRTQPVVRPSLPRPVLHAASRAGVAAR